MPTAIQELAAQIKEKRDRLTILFEKKTADGRFDWSAAERDEARSLNAACDDLGPKLDALRADVMMETKHRDEVAKLDQVRVPGSFSGRPGHRQGNWGGDGYSLMEGKSVGQLFIEHKGYTGRAKSGAWGLEIPEFETKTLFQRSDGYDPFVARLPTIALSPQQEPRVIDLIPTSETSMASIKWMQETTYTNAADTTAEGGAYPEAALKFTEQISPVVKIAVYIPATDEQFEDEPRTRDLLNNRLTLMLRQKLDAKLLTGAGGASELAGLLNIAGIQTQAKGADPSPSAIFKAMTLIQTVGFSNASGIIMNPADWQGIKLLQTADGLYIWGHPSEATPNRIWGLPVVTTTYETLGSAIVGDFIMHTEVIWRRGIEFQVSNSHSDFFINGKQAIRADMRAAFICTRPKAICAVTGL